MKEDYIEFIKRHFEDWQNNGFCSSALALNSKLGCEYFSETNPHFFTGDLEAEFVMVHLNPKQIKDKKINKFKRFSALESGKEIGGFGSFDVYLNYYAKFGSLKYGENASRKHKSPFDHKQIRFIRPFNVLPINSADNYKNLENVIDKKLQIELIPFGSESFDYRKVGSENLIQFIEPVLSFIFSSNRKYVVFCGRVFEGLLNKYIVKKNRITFKLKKNDGQETLSDFEIINFQISINGVIFNGAIAPQYAKQGYPVEDYGKKVSSLYGKF